MSRNRGDAQDGTSRSRRRKFWRGATKDESSRAVRPRRFGRGLLVLSRRNASGRFASPGCEFTTTKRSFPLHWWFEVRNIMLVGERRGRSTEAANRLCNRAAGADGDTTRARRRRCRCVCARAEAPPDVLRCGLSGAGAARRIALATLDNELATAARAERVSACKPLPRSCVTPCPSSPAAACSPDLPPSARSPACSACAPPRRATTTARSRTISTARASSIRTASPPKSLATLLRWYTRREKAEWPAWAPSPYSDTPPARVDGPEWRLSYVGHASWLLQTAGLNILIDPVWSQRVSPVSFAGPKRVNDPGHRVRRAAADRRRAGVALPLRPSRRRDAVAACTPRISPRVHHAARQRHHHEEPRSGDPRRGRTTGTSASSSAATSPSRWCRRATGRRAG